jgi:hypothetical protein
MWGIWSSTNRAPDVLEPVFQIPRVRSHLSRSEGSGRRATEMMRERGFTLESMEGEVALWDMSLCFKSEVLW